MDTPLNKGKELKKASSGPISVFVDNGDNMNAVVANNRRGRHLRRDTPIVRRQRSSSNPKSLGQIKDKLITEVCGQRPRSQSNPHSNVSSSILAAKRKGAAL